MKTETGESIIEDLRRSHPGIAIIMSRALDLYGSWDGDGPSPRDAGYSPYDITVEAVAVLDGRLVRGAAYLGSSWYKPDEEIGEVHGYLPQMIEEAITELPAEAINASKAKE